MLVTLKMQGDSGDGELDAGFMLFVEDFIRANYTVENSSGSFGIDRQPYNVWEAWVTPKRKGKDMVESTSTDTLLAERGKTHGNYSEHAMITQNIKTIITNHYRSEHTLVHRESLEMIAHKIARILAGDPDFRDHWDDIAGYAKLAADRCSK